MRYTVYKVVAKNNNNFISAGDIPKECKQNYFLFKKNYPKFENSKVFVFRELKDAISFYDENPKKVILKGKCRSLTPVKEVLMLWDQDAVCQMGLENLTGFVNNFWKRKRGFVFTFHKSRKVVLGTFLANYFYAEREVTPLEILKCRKENPSYLIY